MIEDVVQVNDLCNSIKEILEGVAGEVCDNLCKYRDTVDGDLSCGYIAEKGMCPLDRLF